MQKTTFNFRQIIVCTILSCISIFATASNYYWVGGTGDWSDYANHWATTSGGVIYHVQEPTPFDDVYFDANSFSAVNDTVKVSATIFTCRSMDWTGALNSPVFTGTSSNGSFNIYGNLVLISNMAWEYNGNIYFLSSTAGNLVKSAGNNLNSLFFNGAGDWSLQDSLHCGLLHISGGTFYSNSMNTSSSDVSITTGDAYFGTSRIYMYGSGTWNASIGNIVDADSTQLIFTGSGNISGGNHVYNDVYFLNTNGIINGNNSFHNVLSNYSLSINGNNLFNKVVANNDLYVDGNNTYDTLYVTSPGVTIRLYSNTTQTINNDISFGGTCSSPLMLNSAQSGIQANISKASGVVNVNYVTMQDINAGGGATFNALNTFAVSNVTGWNIIPAAPQNLYWVNGTGIWNDASHWSTTSGGIGGSCIPTQLDNVFFDANSFPSANDSVSVSTLNVSCNSMDWTGASGNPFFISTTGSVNIHGSLTFCPVMNVQPGHFYFPGISTGNTITTAAKNMNYMIFNGTGDWTLQDSLHCTTLQITDGTFYSNSMSTSSGDVSITGNASAYLGTSQMSVSGFSPNWSVSPSATLDADSTTIIFTSGGNLYGGNNIYHDVFFNYGNGHVSDNNSFHDVTVGGNFIINDSNSFNKATVLSNLYTDNSNTFDTLYVTSPGVTISLQANSTQTIIDDMAFGGTCSSPVMLSSNTAGIQANFSKASGVVNISYVVMQDINASGGATFNAFNTTAISNVTGWNVTAAVPQNLYWVNGTGEWNDASHWSTTSGGIGGSCIPTQLDNVFFDANSFPTASDTVRTDNVNATFHNMDWTSATGTPVFVASPGITNCFGSVTLISGMTPMVNSLYFQATSTGNTITTAGRALGHLYFTGTGDWTLQDSLYCLALNINDGSFYSNSMSTSSTDISIATNAFADFGTSQIDLTGFGTWTAYAGNNLDADSTTISFANSGNFSGGNHIYNDVTFVAGSGYITGNNTFRDVTANNTISINGNNFFRSAFITGMANINDNNIFDTLYLNSPGQTVTLQSGSTQTINNSLMANATGGYPISLVSSIAGTQSTISMSTGDTACLNYIYMQDQNATGGGVFYAGIYSSNISNNTGWQFSNCVQPISDVWPGDANYDLITDNIDILNIGLAFGETGFVRPGGNNTYVAQPCLDWPSQFITTLNTKHADCDGNGIVNLNDTLAVSLNYGITHPPRFGPQDTTAIVAPDLYFQIPSGNFTPGSTVSIAVDLGTISNQAQNIYGIAFSVNYPFAMVVPGTMHVDYSTSWLVSANNNVHLEKDFSANGKIDLGFSRINHADVTGNGTIVVLTFKIANNAAGWMNFSFSNVQANDENGVLIPLNTNTGAAFVGMDEHYLGAPTISVYPNPTSGSVTVQLEDVNISNDAEIEVTDVLGKLIEIIPVNGKKYSTIDLSSKEKGVYFIRVISNGKNSEVRKIVLD